MAGVATRRGNMASLKTIENSAATWARTMAAITGIRGEPGAAKGQIARSAATLTQAKTTIQGFLGPARSAIAPRTGERIATVRPAIVAAKLQAVWPDAGSLASSETK